jgi:DNA-binding response OmpR family regulator
VISVYLLEDHDGLREDTVFALNAEGLLARGAATAAEFAALCTARLPDVAVIDRILKSNDGLTMARQLRAQDSARQVGIVFLTALGAVDEKLEGLAFGDAYLVKPVDMRELAAVVRAVHRRLSTSGGHGLRSVWRLMPRRLELISPQGKVVQVSHKESRILVVLASHDEKLSVRKLVEAMDEDWPLYEKNRLELLLSRLRHKIRATSELSGNPIKSVRNEGYQLTIELRVGEED